MCAVWHRYREGRHLLVRVVVLMRGFWTCGLICRARLRRLLARVWPERRVRIGEYRELLPLDDKFCPTERDIWAGPLWIEAPRLAKALGIGRLRLKDDAGIRRVHSKIAQFGGVARASKKGCKRLPAPSTGNAASSLAYSAAVAGMACNIFVGKKCAAREVGAAFWRTGAGCFECKALTAQAYDLCTQACQRFGWYNRNAAINPYLVEGKKTGG